MRLIASDCPVGDCGAQGLMAMFPRDSRRRIGQRFFGLHLGLRSIIGSAADQFPDKPGRVTGIDRGLAHQPVKMIGQRPDTLGSRSAR